MKTYLKTYLIGFFFSGCICVLNTGSAQITISKNDVTCAGDNNGSIYVTVRNATEPITYAWSDGSSGQSRNNLAAGTYTVTVTDATSCDHTKTVVIEEPDSKLVMTLELLWTPPPHECQNSRMQLRSTHTDDADRANPRLRLSLPRMSAPYWKCLRRAGKVPEGFSGDHWRVEPVCAGRR